MFRSARRCVAKTKGSRAGKPTPLDRQFELYSPMQLLLRSSRFPPIQLGLVNLPSDEIFADKDNWCGPSCKSPRIFWEECFAERECLSPLIVPANFWFRSKQSLGPRRLLQRRQQGPDKRESCPCRCRLRQ